jgi:hypothetical protein
VQKHHEQNSVLADEWLVIRPSVSKSDWRRVMFRFKAGFSFLAVFLLAATAGATPVTFSLEDGTFASGATMSGTLVIDTATGSLVSADLTYTLGGSSVSFDRTFFGQGTIPALFGVFFPLTVAGVVDGPENPLANPPVVDEFDLILPAASLVGYAGGPLCTDGSVGGVYCGGAVFSEYAGRVNFLGNDVMTNGNLVSFAATPEPPEFVLTLTGAALCAFIGFERFRRVQAGATKASSHSFGKRSWLPGQPCTARRRDSESCPRAI